VHTGGLVASGELSAAVIVVGVDPDVEPLVSSIADERNRVAGTYLRRRDALEFENQPSDIYIGDKLARTLEVEVDDRIVLTVSPIGADRPAAAAFYVRGIFHTGLADLDGFYVEIPLADAQDMLGLDGAVTQVALLVEDLEDTVPVTMELRERLAGAEDLEVLPWQQALRELYEAIVLDDAGNYVMLAIIFIIVMIGIFNTVLMSVVERTREFGVMLAIGTSTRRLFATVMAEACILAVASAITGLIVGLSLHYWLMTTGLNVEAIYGEMEFAGIIFEGRVYSTLTNFQIVGWTIVVIGLVILSALYPAWRATRLKPVEAMRHA
jgi:ABC-type lipoprotein release transport system permease subunit